MRFAFAKNKYSTYVLDIGYKTDFHSCIYFISITRHDFDETGELEYAKFIKGFFKRK